ncbi:hypothetical protein [Tenacibaculum geojense]|uniref:hypothetical protein n=1 Tax=Tenacibaculum geojense TaxID=915352 RepID=UPI0036DF0722
MEYYSDQEIESNDFTNTIINFIESGYKPIISIQISPALAREIIIRHNKLDSYEKAQLESEIKMIDLENYNGFEDTISYLLIDGVNLYDFSRNRFKISLINDAYSNFNVYELKIVLCTWAHCGGWGGIVLSGNSKSYNGGGMHGHYLEIEVEGKQYEYNSNYYEKMEKHHLKD